METDESSGYRKGQSELFICAGWSMNVGAREKGGAERPTGSPGEGQVQEDEGLTQGMGSGRRRERAPWCSVGCGGEAEQESGTVSEFQPSLCGE